MSDRIREDFTVTDSWGVDLFCHRFDPGVTPRGAVHLVHGLGDHLFRYQALIDSLADDGFGVGAPPTGTRVDWPRPVG